MTTTIISSIHTQTVWPECIPQHWCAVGRPIFIIFGMQAPAAIAAVYMQQCTSSCKVCEEDVRYHFSPVVRSYLSFWVCKLLVPYPLTNSWTVSTAPTQIWYPGYLCLQIHIRDIWDVKVTYAQPPPFGDLAILVSAVVILNICWTLSELIGWACIRELCKTFRKCASLIYNSVYLVFEWVCSYSAQMSMIWCPC